MGTEIQNSGPRPPSYDGEGANAFWRHVALRTAVRYAHELSCFRAIQHIRSRLLQLLVARLHGVTLAILLYGSSLPCGREKPISEALSTFNLQ